MVIINSPSNWPTFKGPHPVPEEAVATEGVAMVGGDRTAVKQEAEEEGAAAAAIVVMNPTGGRVTKAATAPPRRIIMNLAGIAMVAEGIAMMNTIVVDLMDVVILIIYPASEGGMR